MANPFICKSCGKSVTLIKIWHDEIAPTDVYIDSPTDPPSAMAVVQVSTHFSIKHQKYEQNLEPRKVLVIHECR